MERRVLCPFGCGTSIIDLTNEHLERTLPAGDLSALSIQFKASRPLNRFVKIGDVWDFNNIGVSKQAQQETVKIGEGGPEEEQKVTVVKFLTCGECDKGPLGFVSETGEYYLYC